jgi:hypothetical protein
MVAAMRKQPELQGAIAKNLLVEETSPMNLSDEFK